MTYQTYDELISSVSEFRLRHNALPPDELDRLIRKTFKIDRTTLFELYGLSDLVNTPLKNTPSNL